MKLKTLVIGVSLSAWQFALAQTYAPGACTPIPNSKTCVDTTPCKVDSTGVSTCLAGQAVPPGGISLPQTCWQYSYDYACSDSGSSQNTCTPYQNNAACSVISSQCQDVQQPSGQCDAWTYTYQCQTAPGQTGQQVQCTNGLFDTSQYPTPANPNSTFALAAVTQEMMREGQLYSDHGNNLFAGVKETCRKGYGGLQNCCKSMPGAESNSVASQVAFGAAASVVKYAGEQAVDWASSYMFDAMYNNGLWTDAMTSAFATGEDTFGTDLASSGFSVGAFGFSYSTVDVGGQGLLGANDTLMNFGPGNGFLEFNPYVLAAALVVMYVESLISCNNEEQMLGMHKGANLSVYVSESCSSSILGSCVQWTDSYCSFNSVLAKIINIQGKTQLGLDTSDCTGLSIAQVQQIDFTRIDFSEFTASLTDNAAAHVPTSTTIQQSYAPVMQAVSGGSAQTGAQTTNSNITGNLPNTQPVPPNPNIPTYPGP
jgi:conjugal transfer mating pair stabilization protein TraN